MQTRPSSVTTVIQGIPPVYQPGLATYTYTQKVIQKPPIYTTDSFYQNSLTQNQGATNVVVGHPQILEKQIPGASV